MKNSLTKCISAILLLVMLFSLSACGNKSSDLVGKWEVSSYRYNDKSYSTDEISDLMGDTFAEHYNSGNFTLNSDGTVKSSTMSNTGSYKVSENTISFYDESNTLVQDLSIVDNTLEFEIPDVKIIIVFEKQ